ncbi:ABC transporter permease [Occultella gossypii]|uniref:ABC transporter permease n=1 Tax=Occultella gossypii TaxID=2800820 RepID=A0ABS7S3J7_9MICO|nr:ABC transporter permease [Occultella gossypii]MBZ2194872.1 ABC transporter permease [Occultella gossypii]
MNLFQDALAWLTDPERSAGPNPLVDRIGEHLWYTLLALVVSALIAIPLGYLIGHTGRGRQLAVLGSGAARALPSLGLLTIFTLLVGVGNAQVAAIAVFVILGVPSILAGAYAGVEAVDRTVVDAARAMGMTETQILFRVEAPLGLPLLLGGLRSAALQIIATAVLAAYVGLGGLGIYIQRGISLRTYDEMLGGAILIVLLALAVDALFAIGERVARRAIGSGPTRSRPRPDRPEPLTTDQQSTLEEIR